MASSLFLLAKMVAFQGERDAARALYEESMSPAMKVDDRALVASCLQGLEVLISGKTALDASPINKASREDIALQFVPHTPEVGKFSAYPGSLTAPEVEVLRLMSTGLTDVQAVECLIIRPRTDHAHLSSTYSKLGVSSCSVVTRYALDHTLI
jgi:DNA-binding CsgD family transcriptional regulator